MIRPGRETVTYQELFDEVNKFAAVLKAQGVKKGDRVVIYLPMILELPVAMLACARIGAIHNVIFGGFSAESIAGRVQDSEAKMVITVDGGFRAGKPLALKKNVDEALLQCPTVEKVIVFKHANLGLELDPKKEFWAHELLADPSLPSYVEPERMSSEDPLFILYTSGSTGKPKGVLHTQGGYLLQVAMTTKLVFDLKPDETFWCTADIGWVTGHSYIVYRPAVLRLHQCHVRGCSQLSGLRPVLGNRGQTSCGQILHCAHRNSGPGKRGRGFCAQA